MSNVWHLIEPQPEFVFTAFDQSQDTYDPWVDGPREGPPDPDDADFAIFSAFAMAMWDPNTATWLDA